MTKTQVFEKAAYVVPVSEQKIANLWRDRGFTFGIFRDPPGQEWNGFVHDTDEYVLIAEGDLTVSVGDETTTVNAGDLVRIPRGVVHSLKTTSTQGSTWFYGYGFWDKHND